MTNQPTEISKFDSVVDGGMGAFVEKMDRARTLIKSRLPDRPGWQVGDYANDASKRVDVWTAYKNLENKYLNLMNREQRDEYMSKMYGAEINYGDHSLDPSDIASMSKQGVKGLATAAAASGQAQKLNAMKEVITASTPGRISTATDAVKTATTADLGKAAKTLTKAQNKYSSVAQKINSVSKGFNGGSYDDLVKRSKSLSEAKKLLTRADASVKSAQNTVDSLKKVHSAAEDIGKARVNAQNIRLLNKAAWKTVGKAAAKGHIAASFATGGAESAIRQGLKLNDDIKSMGGTWKDALSATGSVFTTKRGWKNLGWGLLGSLADTANTIAFGLVGDGEKFRKHIDIDAVLTFPTQMSGPLQAVGNVKGTVGRLPPVLKRAESNTATRNKVPTKASAPLTGWRKREYEQKRLLEKRIRERQGLMLLPGEPDVIPRIERRNPRNVPY